MATVASGTPELVPIEFTVNETWLNFHNLESDESLYIDVVTGVKTPGMAATRCPMPPGSFYTGAEKTAAFMLPQAVASRIGTFCLEAYDPGSYSPNGAHFDCHSTVQYWLSMTESVRLGVGTDGLREVPVQPPANTALGQAAVGYAIRSFYPRRLKHSYLGIGVQSAGNPSQPKTLSVGNMNGPLLLTTPATILQAYGGGTVNRLEL